jgi:hypothetical protein
MIAARKDGKQKWVNRKKIPPQKIQGFSDGMPLSDDR